MRTLMITLLVTLAGCATPNAGPVGDAGSTLVALNTIEGAAEMNPLLAAAGPVGGPILSIGLRAAVNKSVRGEPECESVAGLTNAIGFGAACSNLSVVLGAAPLVSVPLLIGCTVAVKKKRANATAAWCSSLELTKLPCTLGSLPDEAVSAQCIDGRLAWR